MEHGRTDGMRWIVGLGLEGHCAGAIRFAQWLADHGDGDLLRGIHVLRRAELFGLAERAMDDVVQQTGATDRFEALRVVEAEDVATALIEACDAYGADALLLARRHPAFGSELNRLGQVGRRMLRALPGPVIITPRDFRGEDAGSGPVIGATDLTDDSVEACRWARRLAARLGRALLLVHIVPAPHTWGLQALAPPRLERLAADVRADAQRRIEAWCAAHDLGGLPLELRDGEVVDALLELGSARRPPVMVAGSRRLGLLARLFTASVGSELAASAPWPVAVVPPGPHPAST